MGYSTEFQGELKFNTDLTGTQLAQLQSYCGEDCRDHLEWNSDLTWINLEITENFDGIKWDGSEKSYDMAEKINFLTNQIQKTIPEFEFVGSLLCQGEDMSDRYNIVIKDGLAVEFSNPDINTKTA